ncbi:Benzoate 1,2-dioxygenase electron transfer component [compost metagenome]
MDGMDRQAGKSVVGTINNRAGTARIGGCDLTWKAGQYGLFSITHKSVKNGTRPFSVSSAPAENAVRITTRIGEQPSEFKKALLELTPGMKITMRGPVGPFYLQDENPALFIAGGIGITPFRSILKQIDSTPKEVGKPIHLLYMDGNREYLRGLCFGSRI